MSTLIEHVSAYVNSRIGVGETDDQIGSGNTLINSLSADAVGLFSTDRAGTLIANAVVGIVLFAWHIGILPGATIGLGGSAYTVVDTAHVDGTDIGFAKLNAQVVGVDPMPVLPVPSTKYGGHMTALPAIWVIVRTGRICVRELTSMDIETDGEQIVMARSPTEPTWRIGTKPVGGDSSSPLVTVVNGELVLLSVAHFPSSGPDISDYHDESVALWLSEFGVTDAFTEADLSEFDNFVPDDPPEEEPTEEPLEDSAMAKTTSFVDGPDGGDVDNAAAWNNGLPSRAAGDTAIIDNAGASVSAEAGAISAAVLTFAASSRVDLSQLDISDVGRIVANGSPFYKPTQAPRNPMTSTLS